MSFAENSMYLSKSFYIVYYVLSDEKVLEEICKGLKLASSVAIIYYYKGLSFICFFLFSKCIFDFID